MYADILTIIFNYVTQAEVEDVSDAGKLQKLFDITKVIMKSKNDAVEETIQESEKEIKDAQKKGMPSALLFNVCNFLLSLKILLSFRYTVFEKIRRF